MRDRPDYSAYVAERSPHLLRTAYLLCRDQALAEDLLQTALVKAWRSWRRIEGDPDPYVYRILVNTNATWKRRRWRGEDVRDDVPERAEPGDATSVADNRAMLWSALGQLPQRQRAVLVLRYFEDLSESRVADIMGCSVGTVKSQANKALAKLRVDPVIAATVIASEGN
jgi:RNA polymerase sigma-70 factor (sigma-E family)